MDTTVTFYHDFNFTKPFNLFEALMVRDAEVLIDEFKIKIPNKRIRKFSYVGGTGYTRYGAFIVDKVRYYFKYEPNKN